jgi:hypothetical protein
MMKQPMIVVVLWDRLKDMLVKLLAVKTIPAVLFSIGYLTKPDAVNGGLALLSWALVVGVRYAEKVMSLRAGKD